MTGIQGFWSSRCKSRWTTAPSARSTTEVSDGRLITLTRNLAVPLTLEPELRSWIPPLNWRVAPVDPVKAPLLVLPAFAYPRLSVLDWAAIVPVFVMGMPTNVVADPADFLNVPV